MRVLLINTSERIGGAAVACSRLMEALNRNGIKAKMLVRDKQSDRLTVVALPGGVRQKARFLWERLCIWLANRFSRRYLFDVDIANAGTDVTRLPEFREADVIHLHWVNQGLLSLNDVEKILASGKRVVWTMHDMWPVTGVCHHARDCRAYEQQCGHCPYLCEGRSERDLSRRVFLRKQQAYGVGRLTFVACSRWLEQLALRSALTQGHRVVSIPNPIDTRLFRPADKTEARRRLGLPADKRLLLFGSVKTTDPRKGVDYLVEAGRLLAAQAPELLEQLEVVIVGNGSDQLAPLLPFPVRALGYVADEHRMADIYAAADLYLTPSLQENLPNTLMESLACGTPCVGFRVGGIPEMIDHEACGYVARYRDAADLAHGILFVLRHPNPDALRTAALHKAASCYSEAAVAKRYIAEYSRTESI